MIALCDEIVAMARMIFRGIPVDEDHLALDLVDEVGIGGQFYATEHTAKFFRTDHFMPRILDRDNYESWKTKGCRSLEDKAHAFVLETLASHRPAPVPDAAQAVIASVLARAAARS